MKWLLAERRCSQRLLWVSAPSMASRSNANTSRHAPASSRLAPHAHRLRVRIKTLLHGFKHMLMLPSFNTPLGFPSLRSGARCASMPAFTLSCVPSGNVARDGASGVAARALTAWVIPPSNVSGTITRLTRTSRKPPASIASFRACISGQLNGPRSRSAKSMGV
jgi:hypothetical protein